MTNKINYLLILFGAFIAIYANADEDQNLFILIIGLVILMVGVYRVSKKIPSKFNDDEDTENNDSNVL